MTTAELTPSTEVIPIVRRPLVPAYRVDLFADPDLQTLSSSSVSKLRATPGQTLDEHVAMLRKTCLQGRPKWLAAGEDPVWQSCVVYSCDVRADGDTPSGNAAFDRARNRSSGLMTGNVSSDVQQSWFIRPASSVKCNGMTFDWGALRQADLRALSWLNQMSDHHPIRQCLEKHYRIDVCAYQIFHRPRGAEQPLIHGWLVTDAHAGSVLCRADNGASRSPDSRSIMDLAEYVIGLQHENAVPVFVFRRGEEVDPAEWRASQTTESIERPRG